MRIKQMKVEDVVPYPGNPRINKEGIPSVAKSIEEFGFRNPILVDGDSVIICGHTRLEAAKSIGLDKVPVIVCNDLSPEKVKALRLADNRSAELSTWDMDLLMKELGDLEAENYDASAWFQNELEELSRLQLPHGQTDEDSVPETPEKPESKKGKIYVLGRHILMCGDSTNYNQVAKLTDGKKADMVFTDPPYGVGYTGGIQFTKKGVISDNRKPLENDNNTEIYTKVLPVLLSHVDGPCYLWFAGTKARDVYNAVCEGSAEIHALIIWHKINATYASMNAQYKQRHEPCLYFKPKGSTLRWCGKSTESTIWEEKRDARNDFHPTQKPVCLAERAIGNHKVKTVLDVFGGSGSTLIACEKTNTKCFMMEIDAGYCDVIRRRWAEFVHGEGCDWQTLTSAP